MISEVKNAAIGTILIILGVFLSMAISPGSVQMLTIFLLLSLSLTAMHVSDFSEKHYNFYILWFFFVVLGAFSYMLYGFSNKVIYDLSFPEATVVIMKAICLVLIILSSRFLLPDLFKKDAIREP